MSAGPVRGWIQLSGENPTLARAELAGAVHAVGGTLPDAMGEGASLNELEEVEVPDVASLRGLVDRLALAHRGLVAVSAGPAEEVGACLAKEGAPGRSAAFRPLGGTRGDLGTPRAHFIAAAYRAGGGTIDLERPDRRFWIEEAVGRPLRVFEEVGVVDRRSFDRRRMPKLPFQRPVSLPPRLGRAAANLAELRPGDPVVDPFVGTGALLLEAGLLGARVSGVDRSSEMVRGAVRNLARFGVEAERLVVADAAETFSPASGEGWAAVLTDPPYGRASGTDGEPPEELVARVLPRWAKLVRPGGCVTMVCPGGPDPLPEPWVRVLSVPDRVHRSLTRDFRVYRRAGGPG